MLVTHCHVSVANEMMIGFTTNRMPTIKIQKLGAEYIHYKSFISRFITLVHNAPYFSNAKILKHLIDCLFNDVLRIDRPFNISKSHNIVRELTNQQLSTISLLL